MPVPPHPHGEPRRRVDPVQAAGRGGSRLGRAASSRAFRRASSAITFAGRVALGRAATRTRWRCISVPLCRRAPEAPPFRRRLERSPRSAAASRCRSPRRRACPDRPDRRWRTATGRCSQGWPGACGHGASRRTPPPDGHGRETREAHSRALPRATARPVCSSVAVVGCGRVRGVEPHGLTAALPMR
jgi:hypothetical protein